jgi:hypothetical protein
MSGLAKAIEQFDGVALEITQRAKSLARSSMSVLIRFISNLMLTRLSGNPRFAVSSWSVGSIWDKSGPP